MFKNNDEAALNIKEAETIIGPSIKVKGNFHGQGNIIIEGSVEGSVKTNGFLLIGEKAKINATIEAKDAKIGGEVVGNIKILGALEIKSSAKILGDIEAKELSIERGAKFDGKCSMTKNGNEQNLKNEN
jgi:cytoskeletal protein CcmA (bactofilin family)